MGHTTPSAAGKTLESTTAESAGHSGQTEALPPGPGGPEGAGCGEQQEHIPRKGWLVLRPRPGQRHPLAPACRRPHGGACQGPSLSGGVPAGGAGVPDAWGTPAASSRPAHLSLETSAGEGYPEAGRRGRALPSDTSQRHDLLGDGTRLRGSDGDEREGHRVQGWGLGQEKEDAVSVVLGGEVLRLTTPTDPRGDGLGEAELPPERPGSSGANTRGSRLTPHLSGDGDSGTRVHVKEQD